MVYIFIWFVIFGLIYKKKLINNKELELTTKFDILFFTYGSHIGLSQPF